MPDPHPPVHRTGPVRWVQLPHPAGIAAQALAEGWLAHELGMEASALAMARDAHGRPWLGANAGPRDVSWSHSGDRLLVALGEGVRVGADLERHRPRPRALLLARRFFEPGETAWLESLPEEAREHAFVRLWCAKEAILKAHGRGIAFGLHRFRVGERHGALHLLWADPALGEASGWTLHEFEPLPGYHAALAWHAL